MNTQLEPSEWYRGARSLVGREWRTYEHLAAEYNHAQDPALIVSARFSIKWKLAYALSLDVASDEDRKEHAYFQALMEKLASEYPEVPGMKPTWRASRNGGPGVWRTRPEGHGRRRSRERGSPVPYSSRPGHS